MNSGEAEAFRTVARARFVGAMAALATLTGCVTEGRRNVLTVTGEPVFGPIVFFAARTEGHGRLRILFIGPRAVEVRGSGVVSDGAITLEDVARAGKPSKHRTW